MLNEFADLQCPFCAQYTLDVLPAVVDRYVRSGRFKREFRTLTIIGADSDTAGRAAAAAALQDRMWSFVDRFYHEQKRENRGDVTDGFIDDVAGGMAGLDVDRLDRDRDTAAAQRLLDSAAAEAQEHRVRSTPSFLHARRSAKAVPFEPGSLDAGEFTQELDQALSRSR